ncbi:endonuclease/exonuclease/phosphatase family protein [Senna tora]|uniref:Endonuclease/exonuclease/phosphatase family protein n=1 Tax=Senna tora TaxID=362788 RepID=A0A834TZQ4_9FABA|nr:endonuclease/exonuclease/phosphatase family protein [Senna tora]
MALIWYLRWEDEDRRTISYYMEPSRPFEIVSKSFAFALCSSRLRVIGSDRAFYFENDSDSGSNTPRVINLRNENTTLPLSSQMSTSVARIPPLVHDYRDDILFENPIDPINIPPTDEVEEPAIEPIANVRRSQRSRKDAIPDDYIVYLQEFEDGDANVQVRLDRALVNQEWVELFPNHKLSHLIGSDYDHLPIQLDTDYVVVSNQRRKKKIFRFEKMWTIHNDCANIIKERWRM